VRENWRFPYVWELSSFGGVSKINVFAMLGAFVGENASEPLQVSNELSPLHLYLELLDDDLSLGKFRQIHRFSDHFDGINQILAGLFQGRALCQCARNIVRPGHPPLTVFYKTRRLPFVPNFDF